MLLLAGIDTSDSPVKTIQTDIVGPFTAYQQDVTITYRYQLKNSLNNVKEKLRTSNATTGTIYTNTEKKAHNVGTSMVGVTFDLLLKSYFGNNGMKIEFSITQNGTTLETISSIIYPAEKETVEVTKGKVKSLVGKTTAFKITQKGLTFDYHDEFNFVGFKDYIDADNYYSLDLRGNSFLYNRVGLSYSTAKLLVPDEKRLFKYLPHDNKGNVSFDLIINGTNQRNFSFSEDIYVNPINLDISKTKITDFIKTNSVYLPLNKKQDFIGKDLKIIISECGLSKYTLIFDVTYDIFRNLIGSCYDSDYCVKGNVN